MKSCNKLVLRQRNKAAITSFLHEPKTMSKPESDNRYQIADPAEFARNMMQVGQQSQRLLADFVKRQSASGSGPRDPLNLTGTFTALLKSMAANPTVIMEAQFQLWRDYIGALGAHRQPHAGRRRPSRS